MARTLCIEVTLTEEMLGSSPSSPDVYRDYIATRAPDDESADEEVDAVPEPADRGMTVFPKTGDGTPFMYDYQWKGFFKDCCGFLRRADESVSKGIMAYKKEIDGLVFVTPRRVLMHMPEGSEMGVCARPLRASTPKGERVAIAVSETVPVGTTMRLTVLTLKKALVPAIVEWFKYGQLHGIGQWRSSGKGGFVCRITDVTDKSKPKVLYDNLDAFASVA